MIQCGFVRERRTDKGIALSECWIWSDCPHQPIEHYYLELWVARNNHKDGDLRFLMGPFDTYREVKEAAYQYYLVDEDLYTAILPVKFCRWPVQHPEPLDD